MAMMKERHGKSGWNGRRPARLLLAAALSLASFAAAAQDVLPAAVQRALAAARVPAGAVHAWAAPVGQPSAAWQYNADSPVSPASVMKLVTTEAALELLGPAFTWKTPVYTTGPIGADGVLRGDLIIKGSGDPTLNLERFWLLLHQLRDKGLRSVDGDVVLDETLFDLPPGSPGAFDGKPYDAYNTLPQAFLANYKATRIWLRAGEGRRITASVEPASGAVAVDNRLTPDRSAACGSYKEHVATTVIPSATGYAVRLSGHYPLSCGDQAVNLNLLDNTRYVEALFRQVWTEMGGQWRGRARQGVAPSGAAPLLVFESQPLGAAIRDMNKYSNNLIARQIWLTLGAAGDGKTSLPRAQAKVAAWLQAAGLDFPELVAENGSGLSRRDRISAAHLGALLERAWSQPTLGDFMASLPVAGVDGTMRHRFLRTPVAGHAHLKSGTLGDVRAEAGFVADRNGQRWAVVAVIDDPNAAAAKSALDTLVEAVWRDGLPGQRPAQASVPRP